MKLLKSSLALALGCLLVGQASFAIAQEYQPRRRGTPDRREGAGTRSPTCLLGPKKFNSFVPKDAISISTTPANTLFWYVPKTTAKTAEIRITEQINQRLEKEVFAARIPLPEKSGVIAYALPPEVSSTLAPGKVYGWQFSLICSANSPAGNPFLEGTLEVAAAPTTLNTMLERANTPRDRATAYAAAGFWQDAIAALATPRCLNPQDQGIQTAWANLLRSVQLGDYVKEPFIQPCEVIKTSQ